MIENPVGWFEIYVQDMARARQFYETVLGVKLEKLPSHDLEMWAFPMVQGGKGITGALVKKAGVPSGGNSTLVYFSALDCEKEGSRVEKAGGRIHLPKTSIGQYGHIMLIQDTEGNLVGLHTR